MGNILHKLSTDEKPQHGFVPLIQMHGAKFLKAELAGDLSSQIYSLPVDVVEATHDLFCRDLALSELLKYLWRPGDYTVQAMECLDKQGKLYEAKYCIYKKQREVRSSKRLKEEEDDELLKKC
ncbi:hypothetical protein TNCV_3444971 [Trichonephila clavipes]|nr:hypothetical protein TNCV_3444971 [Trichonephila clavipes]